MELKFNTEQLTEVIQENLPKLLAEKLSSSYGNPISTIIDVEIKEKDGEIRVFIKTLLSEVFTKTEFKQKIADLIIAKILQNGLR